MTLDPTTREVDFKTSIKKYFLDRLLTISKIPVYFEVISDVPKNTSGNKIDKWIVITFGSRDLGAVSEQFVTFDLFTRKDIEGDDLSALTDLVLSYIIDDTSNNGLVTIPFYDVSDTTWVNVGGIIPFLMVIPSSMEGKDRTKIQSLTIRCKWGGK